MGHEVLICSLLIMVPSFSAWAVMCFSALMKYFNLSWFLAIISPLGIFLLIVVPFSGVCYRMRV